MLQNFIRIRVEEEKLGFWFSVSLKTKTARKIAVKAIQGAFFPNKRMTSSRFMNQRLRFPPQISLSIS